MVMFLVRHPMLFIFLNLFVLFESPVMSMTLTFRVVLGQAYRGLTGGFLWLRIFSVGVSVSPHDCFIFDFYVSKIMHL